jgi:hypothetical protein
MGLRKMIKIPLNYNNIEEDDLDISRETHFTKLENNFYNNIVTKDTSIIEFDKEETTIRNLYSLENIIDDFCKDPYEIIDYLKDENSDKLLAKYVALNYYNNFCHLLIDYTIFPKHIRILLMEKQLKH